jgi:hypothetical protein
MRLAVSAAVPYNLLCRERRVGKRPLSVFNGYSIFMEANMSESLQIAYTSKFGQTIPPGVGPDARRFLAHTWA